MMMMQKARDKTIPPALEPVPVSISNQILKAIGEISTKESPEQIARSAASSLLNLLQGSGCVVFRWDKSVKKLTKLAELSWKGYPEVPPPEILMNYTIITERLVKGTPLVFHRNNINFSLPLSPLSNIIQAGILLPMRNDDETIGLIAIYKVEKDSEFNEEQVQTAQIIAAHTAVTLLRAEVMVQALRRTRELDVLWQTRLSTSTGSDLKEVLNLILDSGLELFEDAANAHIFLYDGDKLSFGAALFSEERQSLPYAQPRKNGVTYKVARSGEMILIPDIRSHPLYKDAPPEWRGAVSCLPLKLGGKVVGVMNIWHENPRPFSKDNVRILNLLADQAAVAISRAEVLQEAQQRTAELEAVWQVNLSLTGSLELEDVLFVIMEKALGLFENALGTHIFLFDGENLSFGGALDGSGQRLPEPYSQPRPNGVTATVAYTGEMLVIDDLQTHPLFHDSPKHWTGSLVSVPLAIHLEEGIEKQVLGVMNISQEKPNAFTPDSVRILKLLGDQAAVAISRAKSLEATQQRVKELEALRKASLSLNASLDLKNVVDAILNATLKISEDTLDVHLFLHEDGVLHFAAAKWSDGVERKPWLNIHPEGLTYQALKRQEPVLVADILSEDPELESSEMKAIIALPLKASNEVVGVMNVAYRNTIQFEDNFLRVLSLIGDQAGMAIANVMLHQTIRRQAMTDSLTGLDNRRTMQQHLQKEHARAQRTGNPFVCVIGDLDNFKRVNDTFGHACGDQALVDVAHLLEENLRLNDHVARWGGEEFYILLPDTDVEKARILLKRIRDKLRGKHFHCGEYSFRISITFGFTAYEAGEDLEETLRRADKALYEGKEAGKDKIVHKQSPPMNL